MATETRFNIKCEDIKEENIRTSKRERVANKQHNDYIKYYVRSLILLWCCVDYKQNLLYPVAHILNFVTGRSLTHSRTQPIPSDRV